MYRSTLSSGGAATRRPTAAYVQAYQKIKLSCYTAHQPVVEAVGSSVLVLQECCCQFLVFPLSFPPLVSQGTHSCYWMCFSALPRLRSTHHLHSALYGGDDSSIVSVASAKSIDNCINQAVPEPKGSSHMYYLTDEWLCSPGIIHIYMDWQRVRILQIRTNHQC